MNVKAKGLEFDTLKRLLGKGQKAVSNALYKAVAEVGSKGRKAATKVEEGIFRLGFRTKHGFNGNWHEGGSKFDSALGAYRGRRKGERMMGWSWETVKARKSSGAFYRSVVRAAFTSRLANLFEHQTKPYSARSPFFRTMDGSESGLFSFRKGHIRSGKDFFYSRIEPRIAAVVPEAAAETDRKLQEMLDRADRETKSP